jgi:hypothetical protein
MKGDDIADFVIDANWICLDDSPPKKKARCELRWWKFGAFASLMPYNP